MWKYSPCLLIVVAIVLLLSSCAGLGAMKASLGQEFSLAIGQSSVIEGEGLQIKFLEVVGDSRCPRGVTCIWAGEVSCTVEITYRESLQRVMLTEPGMTSWPPEKPFQEYSIAYHVEPYPEAGTDIRKEEYRLHLRVSK